MCIRDRSIPHSNRAVERIVLLKRREPSSRSTSITCSIVVLSVSDAMATPERPVGSTERAKESTNNTLEAGRRSVRAEVEAKREGINSTNGEGKRRSVTELVVPGGVSVEEEVFCEHSNAIYLDMKERQTLRVALHATGNGGAKDPLTQHGVRVDGEWKRLQRHVVHPRLHARDGYGSRGEKESTRANGVVVEIAEDDVKRVRGVDEESWGEKGAREGGVTQRDRRRCDVDCVWERELRRQQKVMPLTGSESIRRSTS